MAKRVFFKNMSYGTISKELTKRTKIAEDLGGEIRATEKKLLILKHEYKRARERQDNVQHWKNVKDFQKIRNEQ